MYGVVAALLLAGCAAGPAPSPSPATATSASYAAPAGTVTLRDLGWRNGPAARVVLPAGVVVTRRIDQPNVVSAFGRGADGEAVSRALAGSLPGMGWTVTAQGGGSIVFSDDRHDGTYTASAEVWGLTIRVRP